MFYKAISWNEFIKEVARQKLSSEKLRLTFIDTFGDNESPKIDKTVEGHLRDIYKRFESECPALTTAKKGKKEILRDYLQTQYATQRDVTGISDRPSTPTSPQNIATPETTPELTTLEFIGRDRDLTNLANLRNQYKIVLIKAGAGVGKSTLAREFLQMQFNKVIRIEMGLESGNVTPAEEKVSQILRKDFDEEPSRDFGINLDILREKLSNRANPIGVLIDNLEPALDENYRFREKLRGYDALLAVLGDRDVFSFTLITSRRSLITTRARVNEYSLEGLDITAWRQYFHDCENGADSDALLQMCVAYNGNAKVMDILHGAIKNRFDGNIGAYWNRYKDALLADSELETLISVEMDWLRDNQPDAYKLLCRMGCYRYQDVKTVPFEGLICLLWDVPESIEKIRIIEYLSNSSLIEVKREYYLHPAIREESKKRLAKNKIDVETTNRKAANFWTKNVESIQDVNDALRAFEAYYHYFVIEDFESAAEVLVTERKTNWGNHNEPLGNSLYRLVLTRQAIASIEPLATNIKNPKNLCFLHNILGNCYRIFGDPRKAITHHEKSRNVSIQCNDFHHFQIRALINIGHCKMSLGEFQDAISFFVNVEAADTTEERIIIAQCCLAYVYSDLGKMNKASLYLDKGNNGYQKVSSLNLWANSWARGYCQMFLGKAFRNLGNIDQALSLYNQALEFARTSSYYQLEGKLLSNLAELQMIRRDLEIALNLHT